MRRRSRLRVRTDGAVCEWRSIRTGLEVDDAHVKNADPLLLWTRRFDAIASDDGTIGFPLLVALSVGSRVMSKSARTTSVSIVAAVRICASVDTRASTSPGDTDWFGQSSFPRLSEQAAIEARWFFDDGEPEQRPPSFAPVLETLEPVV